MLERTKIKCTQGSICPDTCEDVGGAGQPSDIVHLAIVRNELRNGCLSIYVPYGARRIYRGGHNALRIDVVPCEGCQGR